jgi:hypothetical protein
MYIRLIIAIGRIMALIGWALRTGAMGQTNFALTEFSEVRHT